MSAAIRHYALTLIMLFSPLLSAAQTPQEKLLAQELSTYRLLTLFHLLRLEQGAAEVQLRLQAEVENFQRLMQVQSDESLANLLPHAQRFQTALLSCAQINGDIDFYALDELSQSAHGLLQFIRQHQVQLVNSPATMDLRQAVLMQQIAAEYVREAASFDSGSAVYDSVQDLHEPVDVLAQTFSQGLEQLQQSTGENADQRGKLEQVRVIWNYIERPLLGYRERSLPFVISRYSEQIVTLLVN
ncbi:conserved exported hypothetical protein [Pseudomonas sp. 8BK]|uniref:hypothetical protein n=1 Tax=Pseudomonas sp. 8BK TaxID=2653164 RepID=UPI0012EEF516|nr:hypothetical protein [Pseudomonas sp. 8BK]VXB14765.1 conserved exported hypothetical protein [Pseudomonas sp. 8BK]